MDASRGVAYGHVFEFRGGLCKGKGKGQPEMAQILTGSPCPIFTSDTHTISNDCFTLFMYSRCTYGREEIRDGKYEENGIFEQREVHHLFTHLSIFGAATSTTSNFEIWNGSKDTNLDELSRRSLKHS